MAKTAERTARASETTIEHFDVLIVGAGISGVGGAYHLTKQCPGTSFVVLEAQESFGGTWLTHRYPGIRSDSDLYTFGYRFKPWTSAPIATAAEILRYMGEVIDENDLARHIRYRHQITSASWSSDGQSLDDRGHPHRHRRDASASPRISCGCARAITGTREGYTPEWDGMADLQGPHRPSAELAGGSRLPGQERRRHRLGRHRGDADSGDRRRLRARHDAAALADLFPDRPQRDRDRRRAARAATSTRRGSTRSCAGRSCTTRRSSPAARSAEPEAVKQELLAAVRAYLGPDYDVDDAFHAELPAVAAAHRLHPGRRPVRGRSAPARPRSSPTRSSASPRPASC